MRWDFLLEQPSPLEKSCRQKVSVLPQCHSNQSPAAAAVSARAENSWWYFNCCKHSAQPLPHLGTGYFSTCPMLGLGLPYKEPQTGLSSAELPILRQCQEGDGILGSTSMAPGTHSKSSFIPIPVAPRSPEKIPFKAPLSRDISAPSHGSNPPNLRAVSDKSHA